MQVVKVFLMNGEVHSYPVSEVPIITISQQCLELAKEEDKEGNLEGLVAGYPVGVWKYYRIFELKS